MKPEFNSRRLFGITRSVGKMYEFGVPAAFHIAVPREDTPEELFLLTLATLGDAAAAIIEASDSSPSLRPEATDELGFAARFFDASIQSRRLPSRNSEIALLAAAAYYLSQRPGTSLVLARSLAVPPDQPLERFLLWTLRGLWRT